MYFIYIYLIICIYNYLFYLFLVINSIFGLKKCKDFTKFIFGNTKITEFTN